MSEFVGIAGGLAKKAQAEKVRMFLMDASVPCPYCDKKWHLHFKLAMGEKPRDMTDDELFRFKIGTAPDGTDIMRNAFYLRTSMWGAHALCGDCFAMRAAIVVEKGRPGARESEISRPWTEDDEKRFWGHLRHQQERYRATCVIHGDWDGSAMEMRDDQRARRREILGLGVVVTRERLTEMNLNWRGAF